MATWDDVRRLLMALPGVEEGGHFGQPAYRVAGKQFAGKSRTGNALIVHLDPDDQRHLSAMHPDFIAPVSGGKREAKAAAAGWTVVEIELCDAALLSDIVKWARSEVAPKRRAGR